MRRRKIIDLTIPFREGMQTYPAPRHPRVEITPLGLHDKDGCQTNRLVMGTHTGTHLDAPRHFIKGGKSIDMIPLDQLVGTASVLDFSELPDRTQVEAIDIKKALGRRSAKRLILRFDWDTKALDTSRYYTDHPYLSLDACKYILQKGCFLLAMDTPQPDNPTIVTAPGQGAPIHKLLLGNDVALVEYLRNIKEIRKPSVRLVVAPLNIVGGDGAPARCFAISEV